MDIRQATIEDLEILVPLFDGYRQFYRQASNLDGARHFLKERLELGESIIYVAFLRSDQDLTSVGNDMEQISTAVGFTQIYPLFSSVSMERMMLLNDLYILHDHRGKGIGKALINKVKSYCIETGQKGIVLQTETSNPAQRLYEREGFSKDPDLHYFWSSIKNPNS